MTSSPAGADITPHASFNDEGFVDSANTSYVTSIASDICRGIEENGRTYAAYGKNVCVLPIDEQEQDRNDLQHCKYILLLGDKLHLSPIVKAPQRILDLGTGSGIWAIDMADKFPTAQVIGVDLAPVQPVWVPPNVQFEVDDIEDDWEYSKSKFDFIHARNLLMAVRNWDRLVQQSFDHLSPGGYLEIAGTWISPFSDDDTLPADGAYVEFFRTVRRIGDKINAPVDSPLTWKKLMQEAGFEDVHEQPFKVPIGPWPKDPKLKKLGALELVNFELGAGGFLMRGFTQVLGGLKEEAETLIARAKSEARNCHMHSYIHIYIVYGRKPSSPASAFFANTV